LSIEVFLVDGETSPKIIVSGFFSPVMREEVMDIASEYQFPVTFEMDQMGQRYKDENAEAHMIRREIVYENATLTALECMGGSATEAIRIKDVASLVKMLCASKECSLQTANTAKIYICFTNQKHD
jgi:hypothetical protein